MKNYLKITFLAFFSFFVFSCTALKKQETKNELKQVASAIVDASIDVAVYKVSQKLKPVEIPLYSDSSHIYIDNFGFVKLDKIQSPDSLHLKFTPVWITIRDTSIVEALKFLKTQNEFVEALVFQSLNYAVIKASERLKPLTVVLPKSGIQDNVYSSPNKIILVTTCANDKCLRISIDAYAFGEVLKRFSRDKLFRVNS